MKLIFGKEVTLQPVARTNDADNIYGQAWHAKRTGNGIVLDYDTGDLAGTDRQVDITEEEFERLRADPEQFLPIVYAHGG